MIDARGSLPRRLSALALALPLATAACGTEQVEATLDAGTTGCATPATARLLPLAVGTSWTYAVSDGAGGTPVLKVSTVEAFEEVGERKAGVLAFRVRTEKTDGATVSWQADACTSVRRHREQSLDTAGTLLSDQVYVPDKLRVDETAEHLVTGAQWVAAYVELEVDPVTGAVTTKDKSDLWTVEAAAEEVTVPAGTFTAARLFRVGQEAGQAEKRYWFAPGVGKVKEVGNQTEELSTFTLAEPAE